MNNAIFYLTQAILRLKQDWETGLYVGDKEDKEEVIRHLQIVGNLVDLAIPKYKKGLALREEEKSLNLATKRTGKRLAELANKWLEANR